MKTMKTLFTTAVVATLASLSWSAWADGPSTDAEVRKVDTAQGKITLKHGEIKNLDMPPMTMVFTVKDPAMLDGVKPGDKIKFKAANQNGKITVTEMTPSK